MKNNWQELYFCDLITSQIYEIIKSSRIKIVFTVLQTWYTDTYQCADDPYCLAAQWSRSKLFVGKFGLCSLSGISFSQKHVVVFKT